MLCSWLNIIFYSFDLVCAIFYNYPVKICNDYGLFVSSVSFQNIFIYTKCYWKFMRVEKVKLVYRFENVSIHLLFIHQCNSMYQIVYIKINFKSANNNLVFIALCLQHYFPTLYNIIMFCSDTNIIFSQTTLPGPDKCMEMTILLTFVEYDI